MWRTDIKRWQDISIETAKFYVELAEKRLAETVETSKSASEKNDKLLTLNVTLITAISTFLSNTTFISLNQKNFKISLLIMLVFLVVQLYFLFRNMFLFKIGTIGEEPKHILNDKFIEDFDDDEQYVNLALQICEAYQEKIDNNSNVNNKRSSNLTIAIYLFLGLPISFLLALFYHQL